MSSQPETFIAAVVQMASGTSMIRNISAMEEGVREAAAAGAKYIQTPEMTGLVQQNRSQFFASIVTQDQDPLVKAASDLAKELSVYLHIGSTPVLAEEQRAANRAFLFRPDGVLTARYDKIHMFDVDLDNGERWRESAVYRPGQQAVIASVLNSRLGMGICYDCRFPVLHTAYAKAGVPILTSPSCFTRQTGEAHWHILMRARAVETGSFMISAAQGGQLEDGREAYGHSLIISPWGEILAEVENDRPGIALAKINPEESIQARRKVPNLLNGQDFTLTEAGKADLGEVA